MSLGYDLAVSDLQTKITRVLGTRQDPCCFMEQVGKRTSYHFPSSSPASPGSLIAEGLAGTSRSRASPCILLSKVILGMQWLE